MHFTDWVHKPDQATHNNIVSATLWPKATVYAKPGGIPGSQTPLSEDQGH